MSRRLLHSSLLSGLLILTLGGCSANKPAQSKMPDGDADLISNRPIKTIPDLFVITLAAKPLLAAAVTTPGGIEIPADAKAAVLNEQAAFEQKLKSVAPQAQILYRYRMTLNGVAVFGPPELQAMLMALPGVRSVRPAEQMARPEAVTIEPAEPLGSSTNSVNFIGGDVAKSLGFTGRGIRVGVIDTGIDYTHSMLGGSGQKADYESVDPNTANAFFPNQKVVGGIDLVGSDFNAASPIEAGRIPKPDANPIDEAGHGTHVAGTIAGHGDGQTTYNGVAPDATLYAIKVFGKDGSTGDAVVIAGFEFAVDPNGDLDPSDHLDVVNLSLGGGFGQPHILYSEAVRNLVRGGVFMVASAGNSGPVDYIVGAPSTSEEALSVAASVDGSVHNWQFDAVRFVSPDGSPLSVKAVEGPISKPLSDISPTEGPLVYIGLADRDLTPDEKLKLQGKVALILRGKVAFSQKIARAVEAGAIGAVVINNEAGNNAIPMGGDGHFDIPAIMIGNDTGLKILTESKTGEVRIQFKTPDKIYEPSLIDSITDFSSKGPRSEDNLFKPEIAAPGQDIVSAEMGEGTKGVRMSGTSMAAPHMAGVMAVLRQARPDLSPIELKSLVMDTSKVLRGSTGPVALTLQGAGRVQLAKALTSPVVITPAVLSLGRVQVGTSEKMYRTLTIRNLSNKPLTLAAQTETARGLAIRMPDEVTVAAGASLEVQAEIEITVADAAALSEELDGQIQFTLNGTIIAHVPAMALSVQASRIRGQSIVGDKVSLVNSSVRPGLALAFNLLGEDPAKVEVTPADAWKSKSCDLKSAGYRIVRHPNEAHVPTDYLQIGYKLHTPLTSWITCEVTALIDVDGDGVADQELAGSHGGNLEGSGQSSFVTMLLDSNKARAIREKYETELASGKLDAVAEYSKALLDVGPMAPFPQSTVAVTEIPLASVGHGADGLIHLKLATLGGGGDLVEADDYLGQNALGDWVTIPTDANAQAFKDLPETVALPGLGQGALEFTRGSGSERLVIYYPSNELTIGDRDNQDQVY